MRESGELLLTLSLHCNVSKSSELRVWLKLGFCGRCIAHHFLPFFHSFFPFRFFFFGRPLIHALEVANKLMDSLRLLELGLLAFGRLHLGGYFMLYEDGEF